MKKSLLLLPFLASFILAGCGTSNPNANCDTGNVCPLPAMSSQQSVLTGATP